MGVKKSVQGSGYIILNIIRAMNVTSLTAVMVASAVMLVKTFVVSKFFFFDAVSHIITACLSMFLIITELPILTGYVARNWPLLSPSSGFVTLGVLMVFTGTSILGNLNKEATSEQSLGLSSWQIVIASGVLTLILGVVNIIANYIFRRKAVGITARMIRSHGAVVAAQKAGDVLPHTVSPPFHISRPEPIAQPPMTTYTQQQQHSYHLPFRALRQSFGLARTTTHDIVPPMPPPTAHTTAPTISSYYGSTLPNGGGRPHSPVSEMSSVAGSTGTRLPPRSTYEISAPVMQDDEDERAGFPKSAENVRRPDSARHPAYAYMNRF